ncbi:hypothetical protein J6590_048549 [Homalodisca vitripennis]|nr:hypothetical protein J6590_048549 [Homalodisca vitripennis]
MEGYIKDIDNLKSKLLEKETTPQHKIADRPCPTNNENELANTSTSLKSSTPKSDGDLHILLLDSEAARDASPQELSDDEDNEITQTRSMSRRIIRAVAVNSNTGRISTIEPQDIPVIGNLKLFGFIPDETPLISTTLCNDDDRPKLCEIGFFDIEKQNAP